MQKLPWTKFFHADWRADSKLGLCSPATRGVWIELLCLMWQDDTDTITGTTQQLSRLCRCSDVQMQAAVCELRDTGTASIEEIAPLIHIKSRRRSKELSLSLIKSASGALGGRPRKHTESKPKANMKARSASAYASASTPGIPDNGVTTPTLPELLAMAAGIGLPDAEVEACWHHFQAQGWLRGNGQRVTDPRSVLVRWRNTYQERKSGGGKGNGQTIEVRSLRDINEVITAKNALINDLRWQDTPENKIKVSQLRVEIKKLVARKAQVGA